MGTREDISTGLCIHSDRSVGGRFQFSVPVHTRTGGGAISVKLSERRTLGRGSHCRWDSADGGDRAPRLGKGTAWRGDVAGRTRWTRWTRPVRQLSVAASEEGGARSEERGGRSEERGARSEERGARSQEPGARSQERGARGEERGLGVDFTMWGEETGRSHRLELPSTPRRQPTEQFHRSLPDGQQTETI